LLLFRCAAGFGLTFGIGLADHTRFNASLKGIAGASSLGGFFAVDMKEYYSALGEFIDNFAQTEGWLFALLAFEANTLAPTIQALLPGLRARGAMDLIRRVRESKQDPIDARMTEVFSHLAELNTARDQLVHWGFDADPTNAGTLTLSNALRAHTPGAQRKIPVSPELISNMTDDLMFVKASIAQRITDMRAMGEFSGEVSAFLALAHQPWRYKPAQPIPRKGKSGKTPPAPQPPPAPSPA
jgi:hypothetical protein